MILALGAWRDTAAQKEEASQAPRFASYRVYDEEVSRRLFTLCDRNRDDRINFREASSSLGLDSPRGFRPCDPNNDGWLHFGEFDRLYRRRVERGNPFIIIGPAAAEAPPEPIRVAMALQQIFRTLDTDSSETVSPKEWRAATPQLASALALVPGGFLGLDRNGSQMIELQEMKRLEILFPQLAAADRVVPPADPKTLPLKYQKMDRNGDQHIDPRELHLVLHQIDPALVPLTLKILAKADRNGDKLLSPREIRGLTGVGPQ